MGALPVEGRHPDSGGGGGVFLPVPAGVEPTGMRMFGIFLGTILALILQPLPTGAVALIGMTAAMLTKTETAARALSGFANTTVCGSSSRRSSSPRGS